MRGAVGREGRAVLSLWSSQLCRPAEEARRSRREAGRLGGALGC